MRSIRTILYPTDFSKCAKEALDHAIFLAEQFDATLHVLHVSTLQSDAPPEPFLTWPDEWIERVDAIGHSAMSDLLKEHREDSLRIIEAKRQARNAAPEILAYAEEHKADCIVMGTHGRRGVRRALLGSVTEEVARAASCPVLTLRDSPEGRTLEPFSCILVPIDFSEHSKSALQAAVELAKIYKAHLHLIHVINHLHLPSFYSPMVGTFEGEHYEKVSREARATMEQWIEELGGKDIPFSRHVRLGGTTEEIISFSKEYDRALLVMATHGLTGLKHFFFGSTTNQVIRYVDCPVWVEPSFPDVKASVS